MAVAIGLNPQEREEAAQGGFPADGVGVVGAVFESERGPVGVPLRLDTFGQAVARFGGPNTKFRSYFCLRGLFTNAEASAGVTATVYGGRVVNRQVYGDQPAKVESLGPPNRGPRFVPPVVYAGTQSGAAPSFGAQIIIGDSLEMDIRVVDEDISDSLSVSVAAIGGTITPLQAGFAQAFPYNDPSPSGSMHILKLTGMSLETGTVLFQCTVSDGRGGTDVCTVLVEVVPEPTFWAAESFGGVAVFGEGEVLSPGFRAGETFLTSAAGVEPNVALVQHNNDGSVRLLTHVSSSGGCQGTVAARADRTGILAGWFSGSISFPTTGAPIQLTTVVPSDRAAFWAEFDEDGKFLWARKGDTGGTLTRLTSATALGDGTTLVAGVFQNTLTLLTSGAPIVLNAPPALPAQVLIRLDATGLALWASQLPFGGVADAASSVAPAVVSADATGQSVVARTVRTAPAPIGNPRARLDSFSSLGAPGWTWELTHVDSAFSGTEATCVEIRTGGGALVGGTLIGGSAYSFPGLSNVTPVGRADMFVARVDGAGTTVWVAAFGEASSASRVTAVTELADGSILAAVAVQGVVTLNGLMGTVNIGSAGEEFTLLLRFTMVGNQFDLVWAKRST